MDNLAPRRGRGRPKGSPNRIQASAKEAIEQAAAQLGGVNRLVEWAQEAPENERVFWGTVYPKLLPLTAQVTGSVTVNWPEPKNALDV
jgi:hypothetical protein